MLEVGQVGGAFGLAGEVVVRFVSNRPERMAVGACFVTDGGELRLTRCRHIGGRVVVAFEGVTGREGAEALKGLVLRAAPIEDDDAMWVHDLVGSEVMDGASGRRLGVVASVLSNPASDILELEDGGLVPASFVVEHAPGRVVVDIPAGLLDEDDAPTT